MMMSSSRTISPANGNHYSPGTESNINHPHIVTINSAAAPDDEKASRKPASPARYRYTECMKNHAAAMGGNARDGCGEFLPNGKDGTLEALICSACSCHRNFHKKELLLLLPRLNNNIYPPAAPGNNFMSSSIHVPRMTVYPPPQSGSEWGDNGGRGKKMNGGGVGKDHHDHKKRRFRTKFTEEQKEKLVRFAEKAGWKMMQLEESEVKSFCEEIGIRRKVLKVWMHNNKHTFSNKLGL